MCLCLTSFVYVRMLIVYSAWRNSIRMFGLGEVPP